MSVIPPKSSNFLTGSSPGFVKPMPHRGHDSRVDQGDSAEFDVGMVDRSPELALELWRKLQPGPDDASASSFSCAGLLLGHFRVEEMIGRGGMGAVFRAVDTRLDREVALKVLAGPQSTDQGAVDRFLNEARAAARLDHDNVARVYFVGEDHGLHYIAFEFIHGANVRQVIEARGNLSPAETVNYGLQIAHALRHVASAGVVHRDVKPSNIIITPTGRAKLVDLGLARKVDPDASRDLTVDGTTLGTFDYISPEQAKNPRSVDIRSDIYSLGCTMYHMATGEPPYPRGTMLQKLLDHQHKDVPEASSRNSNVPPELSAVIRKMMSSDPADRYQTADELISDLSILAHAYGLRPMVSDAHAWGVPGRISGWEMLRRYRSWIATAALLVAGVVAIDLLQSDNAGRSISVPGPETVTSEVSETSRPPATVDSPPADVGSQTTNSIATAENDPDELEGTFAAADSTSDVARNASSVASDTARIGPEAFAPPDERESSVYKSPFESAVVSGGSDLTDVLSQGSVTGSPTESSTASRTEAATVPETATIETPQAEFVVKIDGKEDQEFASLEAACSAAPDGSVVELNFDGPTDILQRPVRVVGKHLRLRRGGDRSPIIRFGVPEEWASAEIVRMISVTRGSLEVYDVGFEVEVDPDPQFITENWVLLSLSQAEEVVLRGVSATMRNSYSQPATMVELVETTSRFDDRMPDAMDRPPVRIDIEDSIFRGQADLFLCENVDPARVRLSNVAAALEGSLIHLTGMDAIDVLSDMNNEHRIELDLRHVTALLGNEVVRFDIEPGREVPRVAVSSDNSVLVTGTSPIVSMSGEVDGFESRQLLEWSGKHSFIQSQDPIWKIAGPVDEWDYDLAEWNDLWRYGHLERAVDSNLLRRDRSIPFDEMSKADLELVTGRGVSNPAAAGASDGTDAGVQWDSLRFPRLVAPAEQ